MDTSILVKLVWLGAIVAIPVTIIAVQKPEVHMAPPTHRVIAVDQPVAINVSGEVQGTTVAEPVASVEPPKPRMVFMGGAKITSKVAAPTPVAAPASDEPPPSPTSVAQGLTAAVAPNPAHP